VVRVFRKQRILQRQVSRGRSILIYARATGGEVVRDGRKEHLPVTAGPLANHGGPTKTHQPQPGSPAINGAVMVGGATTDQRGITRPQGPKPDVGSVDVP
jgi:hypothetical protein